MKHDVKALIECSCSSGVGSKKEKRNPKAKSIVLELEWYFVMMDKYFFV